jgi:hypothetical protein
VDRHDAGRLAPGDGGAQRRDGEVGGHPLGERVADDPVAEQVLEPQQ